MKVRKLGNKGITITEVVISMALLIVITLTTLSLATSVSGATNNAILSFRASNHSVDYIEIFQEAETEDEFKSLLNIVFTLDCEMQNNNSFNVVRDGVISNILIIDNAIIIKCYAEYKKELLLYEYTYWKGV